jgi:beta-glucuronidase
MIGMVRALAILMALGAGGAAAQTALPPAQRPAILMTDAIDRSGQNLSGDWAYSTDLYRTAQTDINGSPPAARAMLYRDVNVDAEVAKQPDALFEFDMDKAPKMALPGAWNAAVPQLRWYDGLMWFQRHFTPEALNGRRAFLRFEAVNYKAMVYLNGQKIGEHEGGFTPFTIEVTGKLRPGDNQITIGVDSTHDASAVPPTVTDWDIYGGVTRPVRLIYTSATYIDDEFIHLDGDGHIRGEVHLNGASAGHQAVTVKIGTLTTLKATTDGNGNAKFDIPAPKGLKLWSPDTPTLYAVTLAAAGDSLTDHIGFRTIKVQGTDILLNGKPIFLRGISMHEEEIGPNPSRNMTPEASRALLSEIKNGLHGNYVRLSHYPHSEVTTRLADEMGLMVWSEIPVYWSVDFGNDATLAKARAMLAENILRDRNRAAIIIWSVGNETPNTPARLRFLSQLADDTKALDGTRLTSAALLVSKKIVDGHIENTIDDPLVPHLDIMAANTYNGWYGDDHLADLPGSVWHMPEGKPLIFSEFGADAKAGFHDPVHQVKFSEEYQAAFIKDTLAMVDKIPALRGMSPWVLKDFQSPRRQQPVYQQGWNRKGLISETGQRKLAFDVLADYYAGKK